MASMPGPSNPGDDPAAPPPDPEATPAAQDPNALLAQAISPEQAAQGVALSATVALGAGHDWNDISDAANANGADVQRPSIGDLWYGPPTGREYYGQVRDQANDAINEGAGPIGEAIIGLASGSAVGAIRGAIGTGVLSDVAGAQANPVSRIAQMGVKTDLSELSGRKTELDFAAEDIMNVLNRMYGGKTAKILGLGTVAGGYFGVGGSTK